MSLSGSSQHCHLLLTPILRELGDATDSRWLTLIAPPAFLSQSFLRKCGLNRERIILLQPRNAEGALELACKALASGCSHTVISWLGQIDDATRSKLRNAASLGEAQSLNIRLGCWWRRAQGRAACCEVKAEPRSSCAQCRTRGSSASWSKSPSVIRPAI